ncbi:MAG: hypothetical protein NTY22_04475 [Proteobacteria bacterium]|nr:hypothetical protein [Pseudomonadota bacterium]
MVFSLAACNNNGTNNSSNTPTTDSSAAPSGVMTPASSATIQCPENSALNATTGNCVCVAGYKFNSTGTCVTEGTNLGIVQLAKPFMLFGVNMQANIWHYDYSPVTDVNEVEVPTAVIRTMHITLTGSDEENAALCSSWAAEPMDCTDGDIHTGQVDIPNGHFCVKAIACDDNYQTSDISYYVLSIYNSFLDGEL